MLVHWDDVEPYRRDIGRMRGEWTDLGLAAGSVDVGVRRIRLAAGEIPTPAHVHILEEEIFYVLGGSGRSWQGGATFEIGAGDCLVHRAGGGAHTLRGGPDGLDVLAFGHRTRAGGSYVPHGHVFWLDSTWTDAGTGRHPYEREPELDWPEPSARPPSIVNADDVEPEERDGATVARARRDLGRAAGSVRTGMKLYDVRPGKLGAPPHCHSAEEELFVVLDGEGTLLLGDEELAVRRGHALSRPPGTGVAHAFMAGERGLSYLAYGTREPNDITYYPRSGKVFLRGVGVVGRIEPLDYWEDED
jgi:uncharacterized cupin superfamily protein